MRLIPTLTLCALIAASVPVAAADKAPVSLARQGGWEINYDTDACNVFGVFGTGDQQTILGITRFAPGDGFDLGLIGKPLLSRDPQTPIELGYGSAPPVWWSGTAGRAAGKLPMIMVSGQRLDGWYPTKGDAPPSTIAPAQEASVRAITFKLRGGKRYQLETGPLAKPMEAMRACVKDLVQSWGYDSAVQENLSRPLAPLSNPDMWFRSADFPMHAAMQGHNGSVQARLDVDAAGKLSGCHVLRRTNPDEFAEVTCEVLTKRAKFSPALDAAGKPVKSFYMFKLRWVSTN